MTKHLLEKKAFLPSCRKLEWKLDTLIELWNNIDLQCCVIYCNTKQGVQVLAQELEKMEFQVRTLHYDITDADEIEAIWKDFRTTSVRFLITTDLVTDRSSFYTFLIINYCVPCFKESYMHRLGAKAFGRRTVGITFVTEEELGLFREIEVFCNTRIEELPLDVSNLFS